MDIQIWMGELSMTEVSDYTRRAGQQRWRYATAVDRKLVGSQLAPYRLNKEEACRRLAKARAVKARMHLEKQMFKLDLSSRPRVR